MTTADAAIWDGIVLVDLAMIPDDLYKWLKHHYMKSRKLDVIVLVAKGQPMATGLDYYIFAAPYFANAALGRSVSLRQKSKLRRVFGGPESATIYEVLV